MPCGHHESDRWNMVNATKALKKWWLYIPLNEIGTGNTGAIERSIDQVTSERRRAVTAEGLALRFRTWTHGGSWEVSL